MPYIQFHTSLVILTLNQLHHTKLCLESLLQTNWPGPCELILVDNGSTDGTLEYLAEYQRRGGSDQLHITVVLNDYNRGCSGGRNQGFRMAAGRYVGTLDNDVEIVDPDWLRILAEKLESHRENAIVAPKLLYPVPPYLLECAGIGFAPNGQVAYLGRGCPGDTPEYNVEREVQAFPAAAWLVRRQALERVGYFDDAAFYPVQYEDLDLCYRLRMNGWRIMYTPSTYMYHHEHVTTANSPKEFQFRRLTAKNGVLFERRWLSAVQQEPLVDPDGIYWGPLDQERKPHPDSGGSL